MLIILFRTIIDVLSRTLFYLRNVDSPYDSAVRVNCIDHTADRQTFVVDKHSIADAILVGNVSRGSSSSFPSASSISRILK